MIEGCAFSYQSDIFLMLLIEIINSILLEKLDAEGKIWISRWACKGVCVCVYMCVYICIFMYVLKEENPMGWGEHRYKAGVSDC